MKTKQTLMLYAFACVLNGTMQGSLVHLYEFNGSYADSKGGDDIVTATALVPTTNAISGDLYHFGSGEALFLPVASTVTDNYSLVLDFTIDSLQTTSGWGKIFDFKDPSADFGVYRNLSDKLQFYDVGLPSNGPFGTTTIVLGDPLRLVITRNSSNNVFSAYINGTQEFTFVDTAGDAIFNTPARFLIDDTADSYDENPVGSVGLIGVYDNALDSTEVSALGSYGAAIPEPNCIVLLVGACGFMGTRRRM